MRSAAADAPLSDGVICKPQDMRKVRKGDWPDVYAEFTRKHGLSDRAEWTTRPSVALAGLGCSEATRRSRAVIDIACAWVKKEFPSASDESLMKGFFVATSSSAPKKPWSYGLKTLLTSSEIYSYEHDRMLTPQDLMRQHGWRAPNAGGLSFSAMRGLHGESVACQQLGCLVWAAYLAADFPGMWEAPYESA